MSSSEPISTHLPCPDCGSSDALAEYSDGHTHCFSCGHTTSSNDNDTPRRRSGRRRNDGDSFGGGSSSRPLIPFGHFSAITSRGLSEETCQRYGYFVGRDPNIGVVQVAQYRDKTGQVVGQKFRTPDKQFGWAGARKEVEGLFGQHLWRTGGKRIAITEGEIDALSLYQALGGKWPAVSLVDGAGSALKDIRQSLEFLESYDKVVLMFDEDKAGREAIAKVAPLFTPGKVAIASLPLKDANEMLKERRVKDLITAFWEARDYRPDGVVNGADLWEEVCRPVEMGIQYPWQGLTKVTYGQRQGELVSWTAGTGIGKSAFVARIAYDLLMAGYKIGYVALEENTGKSIRRMLSHYIGVPVHLPNAEVEPERLKEAFEATMGTRRFILLNHWGSLEEEQLLSRIKYLAAGEGCDFIILDHISIVVSGMDLGSDERRAIDYLMTELRSTVERTGVGMHIVTHLSRAKGSTPHENGGEITLRDLRGSQAIAQLSDIVVAIERDQQADDETSRNRSRIRVLKNRYSGTTGPACDIRFDPDSGSLTEVFEGEDEADDEGPPWDTNEDF